MKNILAIIIIFLLIILQSSFYPYLNIYGAFPSLILISVLILSIVNGIEKSLIWIIIGGFFLDIFSFKNPVGVSILGLFLAGYLAYFLSQSIFKKTNILSIFLIGLCGTLIYTLFLYFILFLFKINFQFSFKQLVSQIIYNLIILLPLFYLIKKIKNA